MMREYVKLEIDKMRLTGAWWWMVVPVPAAIVLMPVVWWLVPAVRSGIWFPQSPSVLFFAGFGLYMVSAVRRRRLVRASAGRVCIHCLYSLADLEGPGVCPECGKAYPEDGYLAEWKAAGVWRAGKQASG